MIDIQKLDQYRLIGDSKADDFVQCYFSNKELKIKLDEALSQLKTNANWPQFVKNIPEALWFDEELNLITPIDSKTYQTALKFYKKREAYILQLLGLLSLPYCYAAADGAKVLYQTERMYKDVSKRLEETAAFVTSMMNPKAFNGEGDGKVQLFKVRVMHAAARYYLQKSNWDKNLGLPVNQEDMAGTNLSFSLIVIRGLRKMGFSISYQEQMAYIKYWSWIGALLGLHPELLPQDGRSAYDLESLICRRHFKTSKEGKELALALLKFFYQVNPQREIRMKKLQVLCATF